MQYIDLLPQEIFHSKQQKQHRNCGLSVSFIVSNEMSLQGLAFAEGDCGYSLCPEGANALPKRSIALAQTEFYLRWS